MLAFVITMVKLREWRNERGLSLRKLGAMAGVSFVTLARIEAGKFDPRLSTLVKLCQALNVKIGELVNQPQHEGCKHGRKGRSAKR